jgi:hypothetical protein
MPTIQPDESDYKVSPAYTFVGSTQNNRKHPAELIPGQEFVKLTMFMGERDVAPSWPWPTDQLSFGATIHGPSPGFFQIVGGESVSQPYLGVGKIDVNAFNPAGAEPGAEWWCADWFEVGAYLVALRPGIYAIEHSSGQITGINTFHWTSPGILSSADFPVPADETNIHYWRYPYTTVITAFDVYYDVLTTILISGSWGVGGAVTISYTNRYYTGGGWEAAAGVGTFWWAIMLGLGAVTFDSTGIGRLEWSGDINIPFSFRKSAWGFITAGWPVPIGGLVYFIDTGGCFFATDGSSVDQVDGPFNAHLIPELTDTWPAVDIRMVFDEVDHRVLVYMGPEYVPQQYDWGQIVHGGLAMIDFKTAQFSFTSANVVLFPMGGRSGLIWEAYCTTSPLVWSADRQYSPGDLIYDNGQVYQCLIADEGQITQGHWQFLGNINEADTDLTLNPTITTGGFQLTKPEYGVHVHYLDLDIESEDDPAGMTVTPEIRDVYSDDEADWVTMPDVEITATGRALVRLTYNRLISRAPQFRFTLNDVPQGKVRIWGVERVVYQEGGLRI